MDKQEREQYMASRIFSMLDIIEEREGAMAHEIDGLKKHA